jgi:hypothetical protein
MNGLTILSFCTLCASVTLVQADDSHQPASPSPNQNKVHVKKPPPRAAVTGVQSQPAGPPARGGSLDPSQQSSMGLGIKIPFGHSDTSGTDTAPQSKESKDSKDNDDE